MENKLLIVDGTSILAEAYHKSLTEEFKRVQFSLDSGKKVHIDEINSSAETLLQSKKGTPINGVQGFFKILFDALDKTNPTHLIVTWGALREDNFRRKIYSNYKNDGLTKGRATLEQEAITKSLLKGMGIFQLESKTLEALDLTGLLITKFKQNFEIEVLARNTLSLQFTDDAIVWFRTPSYKDIKQKFNLDCSNFPSGSIKFDKEFLLKYKNLTPEQIPDYRALIGNSFSKIPGVKSVGEVTTLALLEEYESIENLYDDIDSCTSQDEIIDFGKQLTKHLMLPFNPMPYLVKGREEAFLGKELVTYKRDEESALKINADESEFNLTNVSKIDVIKQLKSVCLAPITCNITKKLSLLIETLDYSSLLVMYNPCLFSPSSNIYAGEITSFNTLDDVELDMVPCDDIKDLVFVEDMAIKAFASKIKFNLSNSDYYSDKSIEDRALKTSTGTNKTAVTLSASQHDSNKTNGVQIPKGHAHDLTDELNADADKEIEEECSEAITGHSNSNLFVTSDVESAIVDNTKDAITDSEDNQRKTSINIDEESDDCCAVVAIEESSEDSNTKPTSPALNLLEQLVINKYSCNKCGKEFALFNSIATHCVHCGANSITE